MSLYEALLTVRPSRSLDQVQSNSAIQQCNPTVQSNSAIQQCNPTVQSNSAIQQCNPKGA